MCGSRNHGAYGDSDPIGQWEWALRSNWKFDCFSSKTSERISFSYSLVTMIGLGLPPVRESGSWTSWTCYCCCYQGHRPRTRGRRWGWRTYSWRTNKRSIPGAWMRDRWVLRKMSWAVTRDMDGLKIRSRNKSVHGCDLIWGIDGEETSRRIQACSGVPKWTQLGHISLFLRTIKKISCKGWVPHMSIPGSSNENLTKRCVFPLVLERFKAGM